MASNFHNKRLTIILQHIISIAPNGGQYKNGVQALSPLWLARVTFKAAVHAVFPRFYCHQWWHSCNLHCLILRCCLKPPLLRLARLRSRRLPALARFLPHRSQPVQNARRCIMLSGPRAAPAPIVVRTRFCARRTTPRTATSSTAGGAR